MAENILDKYVRFLADDLQHVIDGFDNTWGFPNCAGAVDGTHIPIIAPESAHCDYVNRNGWYSIVLTIPIHHNHTTTILYFAGCERLMHMKRDQYSATYCEIGVKNSYKR